MRCLMRLVYAAVVGSILLVAGSALAETTDQAAISKLLHGMFDRPDTQLVVAPDRCLGNIRRRRMDSG
jgi:hypothetical protein